MIRLSKSEGLRICLGKTFDARVFHSEFSGPNFGTGWVFTGFHSYRAQMENRRNFWAPEKNWRAATARRTITIILLCRLELGRCFRRRRCCCCCCCRWRSRSRMSRTMTSCFAPPVRRNRTSPNTGRLCISRGAWANTMGAGNQQMVPRPIVRPGPGRAPRQLRSVRATRVPRRRDGNIVKTTTMFPCQSPVFEIRSGV